MSCDTQATVQEHLKGSASATRRRHQKEAEVEAEETEDDLLMLMKDKKNVLLIRFMEV